MVKPGRRAAVAPRPPSPAEVRRLRNAALVLLAGHPDLPPSTLARLPARCIRQRPRGAGIYLSVRRPQSRLAIHLDGRQSAALLRYVEAADLWGRDGALFPCLGTAGIYQVLWRSRGRP